MMEKPAYFEEIRAMAAADWEHLRSFPALYGPWRQLFMQIQEPKHVLSELLQNADDVGATEVSVRIEDGAFVFWHNGADFTKEHFLSLCRFAFSNKRTLRTIGFRGIGFKSTFSLGDHVELYTPTLSVVFEKDRFTEPNWVESRQIQKSGTCVRVVLADDDRKCALEKSLRQWSESPLSLLFFNNIQSVEIEGDLLQWSSQGPGPVSGSEWKLWAGDIDSKFLVVRSEPIEFSLEAQAEIRNERMLVVADQQAMPSFRIEIVVGAPGRLFAVLPTDVLPPVPFACNAPFVPTPDRASLKAPEISPTNRFLLDQVGILAAHAMLEWLGQTSETVESRSDAYSLLPELNAQGESLAASCANAIALGFSRAVAGHPLLLTQTGDLVGAEQAVVYPRELFDVWPEAELTRLLDEKGRPAFSRYVKSETRRRLAKLALIKEIDIDNVVDSLCVKRPVRPETWEALMKFWAYVERVMVALSPERRRQIALSPVNGRDHLHGAGEIVRLGEKRKLHAESDWEFLSEHLLVLDQRWLDWLADLARNAEKRDDKKLRSDIFHASIVFKAIGLDTSSETGVMIDLVASRLLTDDVPINSSIRLAQIAARLRVPTGSSFRFFTEDNRLRSVDEGILFDPRGALSEFLPESWRFSHVLHPSYSDEFLSCTSEEWSAWVASGHARLLLVPPITCQTRDFRSAAEFEKVLRATDFPYGKLSYYYASHKHYSYQHYYLRDCDFPSEIVEHWNAIGPDSAASCLLATMLGASSSVWQEKQWVVGQQTPSTRAEKGNLVQVKSDSPIPAAWLRRFSKLACIPDTRGQLRKPSELLLRNNRTEAFLAVESFVDYQFDTENAKPLLKALGVRDTPPGPDRLLDRLRALSSSVSPPEGEIDKLYHELDNFLEQCTTADAERVKAVFRGERVILTEAHGWATATNVFQSAHDDDVPGAAVIRATVRDLALWNKVGVAPRPTIELAIKWLNSLPIEVRLSADDMRRVRALLAPHRLRIWTECRRWLNLAGEWGPVDGLRYSVGKNTSIELNNLHDWVTRQTADLRDLANDVARSYPFQGLAPLSERIEYQFQRGAMALTPLRVDAWMQRFGVDAQRIVLEDAADMERIRAVAADLAQTRVAVLPVLEHLPYVDGRPAGTAVAVSAVWMDHILYIDGSSRARLARPVADQIGIRFNDSDIKDALLYCYERSPEDVSAYLEENFDLAPQIAVPQGEAPEADDDEQMGMVMPDASDPGQDELPEDATADGQQHELFDTPDGHARRRAAGEAAVAGPSPAAKLLGHYARSQGFVRVAGDFYRHPDGSRIVRRGQTVFAWQRLDPQGETIFYFRVTPHCLTCEPLEVDAEVWDLLAKFPHDHGLLLSDPEGRPILFAGAQLVAMRDSRTVTLHPAAYRLVYNQPNEH